jgi:Tfp pilus assembly protein PilF
MGSLEMLRGHKNRGMVLYKRILSIDPHNSNALNNIGAMGEPLVDALAAFNYLNRAIQAAPDDYAPHVNIASLYYQHGDTLLFK